MNKRKPNYFRNSLDLRDKVQVKVLRKRLKLSEEQFRQRSSEVREFDFGHHQGGHDFKLSRTASRCRCCYCLVS